MIADPRLGSTSLTTGREDDEGGRGGDNGMGKEIPVILSLRSRMTAGMT